MGADNTVASKTNHQRIILVVGLGKTGLSCVRYLSSHGHTVRVADSRQQPPGISELQQNFPDVEYRLGEFDADWFCEAKEILLSPGVALSTPAIQASINQGAEVYGDIEMFARYAQAPIVAVTGSNGKSTLVTLLAEMVAASHKKAGLGGNIGTPVLELLQQAEQDGDIPDFYVLELSSFQLETTSSLNALASVILNVSPDHMDRYTDLKAYAGAKQRIYSGDGWIVVNKDDAFVQTLLPAGRKAVTYSTEQQADFSVCYTNSGSVQFLCTHGQPLMALKDLRMPGMHNVSNALAALALGEIMQLDRQAMIGVLKTFTGLPHRTQYVGEIDGVRWYNDSKGTNVGATIAAVQGMMSVAEQGKTVLIAGGEGKGADFSELLPALKDTVRAVVLIGRDAPLIDAAIKQHVSTVYASDMDDAVQQAARLSEMGDKVLLSPACASFDMYSGYEQRGEVFMQAVHGYIENAKGGM